MAQADVRFDDGLWIITIPKGLVVLTEAELVRGLRRGKWYARRQAKRVRIAYGSGSAKNQEKTDEGGFTQN